MKFLFIRLCSKPNQSTGLATFIVLDALSDCIDSLHLRLSKIKEGVSPVNCHHFYFDVNFIFVLISITNSKQPIHNLISAVPL